ncbi:HPr family phosphocarrier protein [Megasphaera coli]|uniref:HPr family phosphocarrier protein n=1 Tax=Colibacter massiliensis TaxID=1852379 RepID=UPI00094F3782|nr:HPr family phosphocarrier protein [Colibacter massiliensis]
MKSFTYTITDLQGIHARPAGLLVKEAKRFDARISLEKGEKKGDAKKIFNVMTLGAKQGDLLTVVLEGPDEEAAAQAMEAFLHKHL